MLREGGVYVFIGGMRGRNELLAEHAARRYGARIAYSPEASALETAGGIANALHLLEYRLQELGHPTAGFVLLIPHYLSNTEYPVAAVTALESVSAATGLIFPTDRLREEGRDFVGKIDGQVEGNQELAKLVGTLEDRHDSYMEENPLRAPLTDTDGELPTADEIGAAVEQFLAEQDDPGDGRS